MHAFWDEFSKAVEQTKDLKISDVIAALDAGSRPAFLPARARTAPIRASARPAAPGGWA